MSRPIDEKIVKMKLDNSDFQSKASQTVGIFGKLNQAFGRVKNINLSRSVADLSSINGVASKTDMSGLVTGLSNATSKFSAMGIIGMSVLNNITNKAINAGTTLAKQFTMDPILQGFGEYELKMGSIQTILANTSRHGTTLDQVTASLEELNTYADKTIYNFGDMTKNIGLFTNAGLKVEDATSMIKGFSNEAAMSGTTAEGASGAAYQLSQALSTGTIRLMDWRSLTNVGMGNKNMQNDLVELAGSMGTLEANSVTAAEVNKDFNGSLEKNWLSADVMSKYLQIMAGDLTDAEMATMGLDDAQIAGFKKKAEMGIDAATKVRTITQLLGTASEAIGSGWSKTFELLFGDFNEATEMFTSANNAIGTIIDNSSKARNDMLEQFTELGGRSKVIDIIKNSFSALVSVFTAAKGGLDAVFPAMTAERLMGVVSSIADFTAKLKMNSETSAKVQKIFQGLFSILSIGITIAKTVGQSIVDMIPEGAGKGVLDFVKSIAELIIRFDASLKSGNAFTETISNVGTIVKNAATFIWDFASAVTGFLIGIGTGVGQVAGTMAPIFEKITSFIGTLIGSLDIKDVLNVGFIAVLAKGVSKIGDLQDSMGGFLDGFTDMFGTFKEAAANLGGISDALESMTTAVKVGSLLAIAVAVGLLALSIKLIAGIDAQDIAKSLEVIAVVLIGLTVSLNMIGKLDFTGGGTLKATTLLITISAAVMTLALAMKVLSTIDSKDMMRSLISLVVIVTTLVAALKILSSNSGSMVTSSAGMLALSVSVVILAGAVKLLSTIESKDLAKSVIALGIILLELAIFLKIANNTKLNPGTAVSLVIISAAVLVMVHAITQLGNLDVGVLVQGLIAITLILLQMAIFVKVASGSNMISASIGMIAIALAMNMMVPPIAELGGMDMGALAQGLIALTIVLVGMVAAMTLANGSLAGAAAILIVAAAISILVPPLVALGNLSLAQVGIALIALAGAFIIIGVAAMLLGPAGSIAMVAFALGLTAVGFAMGMVGVTILAFTAALTALAALTVTGIASIIGALSLLLIGLVTLIPQMVTLVVTFVTEMARGFAEAGPAVAESMGILILGVLTAMATYIPKFAEQGMLLLTGLIEAFTEYAPPLITAGVELIISLIDGMAVALEENHVKLVGSVLRLVKSILLVIVEAMVQLVDVLFGWIPGVSAKTKAMGESAKDALDEAFDVEEVGDRRSAEFGKGIEGNNGDAESKGKALGNKAKDGADSTELKSTGGKKGLEFNTGLANKQIQAQTSGKGLGTNAKTGAGSVSLLTTGNNMGNGFNNGLASKASTAKTKGTSLATSGKAGAGSVSFMSSGENAGTGFANGISGKEGTVKRAAEGLAGMAKGALEKVLSIFSPSRVMRKDGGHFGEGFVLGIIDKYGRVSDTAAQMAQGAVDAVRGYAATFSDTMLENMDLNPTISPILDLSNIGSIDIPSQFNVGSLSTRGIDVNTNGIDTSSSNVNPASQGDTYNIKIEATGELPDVTIKRMANQFQTEIKNQNDRRRLSRGEAVIY